MNIKDCVDFINFWIRKERGAFLTIEESMTAIDRGQIAYYNDMIQKYAVSQIVKDTLMPFKETYEFSLTPSIPQIVDIPELFFQFTITVTAPSVGNVITVANTSALTLGELVIVNSGTGILQQDTIISKITSPTTFEVDQTPLVPLLAGDTIDIWIYKEYLDLLDLTIQYYNQIGNIGYYSVKMTNEDELADRLNSQINPPMSSAPVGIMSRRKFIQLYPANNYYVGFVNYMRRPKKPVYGYSVVGGRSIVYDPSNSVQLEWKDSDIDAILLKALMSVGINLSDAEVGQFAQMKTQENYQGVNHL